MKNLVLLAIAATVVSSLTLAQAPKSVSKFVLTVTVSEPFIQKGKLQTQVIKKSFALDAQAIARSRKFSKISSALEPKLSAIFKALTREGKDARFNLESGSWIARQRSAWMVDEKATRANLLAALKSGKSSAQVALTVKAPQRNVRNWAESGITTLYGKGVSSFKGSPVFRVRNIIVGASKLDNDYIEKDAELDFNASVGAINKATGFVEGFVIIGGTLEKEDGGGICQVSTTVWRAAYAAGLPIVQRSNHSYRVHYYDPPGMEATVFSPYKNLRFKNDTPSPMFIQMTWYTRSQRLELHFFGAKPDRKVSISDPYIYNVRPPAGPRFQADPNVRLGSVRRIDSPERGMSVTINRSVRYDDGRKLGDVTRSTYVPWGAIYAVNPRDSRL